MKLLMLLIGLVRAQDAEEEPENIKVLIYERPRLYLGDDRKIDMFIGIDSNGISPVKVKVDFDFESNSLMIPQSAFDCVEQIYCYIGSPGSQLATNKEESTYTEARAFVGPIRLMSSQIDEANYRNLSIFRISLSQNESILGLSPNSTVWEDWNEIYFFSNNTVNITLCLEENHKALTFTSYILPTDVLLSIPKTELSYNFDSVLKIDSNSVAVKTCVLADDPNLVFALSPDLYRVLLTALCKNPLSCQTKSDLANLDGKTVTLVVDNGSQKGEYSLTLDKLMKIENDKIVWNIKQVERKGCDLILESLFFNDYYFFITNRIDSEKINFGFRKIKGGDFFLLDSWKYTIPITGGIMIIYIALNMFRKSRKNEEEVYHKVQDAPVKR